MNKKGLSDIVRSLIPVIKAQVAEEMNINVNVHIGDVIVRPEFPQHADPQKIAALELTPEVVSSVVKMVNDELKIDIDQKFFQQLPHQAVATATAGALTTASELKSKHLEPSGDENENN